MLRFHHHRSDLDQASAAEILYAALPAGRRRANMPIGPFLQHDHSFDPEDIANMSAGFEAALSKLGVVSRRDNRAKVAIAKMIIEVAKEGERDPARLCDEAVNRLSK
jgi:hypothetical protein